ncbi:uncharacterized protein LOC124927922 [Impatiens glandulifera]|uniref:uncharacterized protein LOC124927922 n=1 Tax=Impatiens glandulifera TaxID=253017 RepID=UPI001FB102F8|nr:uncharacterized protein LOC124927922 [Impatiens glandulifera]
MGAMTTSCYLNLTPPTKPLSNKIIITQVSWPNKDWSKRWAIGVASVIISLEIMGNVEDGSRITAVAMAKEETETTAPAPAIGRRWSEKRMCPSWKSNSLEIIVPENLPRPFTRRRWEAVGYVHRSSLKDADASVSSCFKM